MNELQMKLARRRNLNGENNGDNNGTSSVSAPVPIPGASVVSESEGNRSRKNSDDFVPSTSPYSASSLGTERPLSFRRTTSRDVPVIPSSSPSSSSGLNELQMKLQRRKQLNGEENKTIASLPPVISAPIQTSAIDPQPASPVKSNDHSPTNEPAVSSFPAEESSASVEGQGADDYPPNNTAEELSTEENTTRNVETEMACLSLSEATRSKSETEPAAVAEPAQLTEMEQVAELSVPEPVPESDLVITESEISPTAAESEPTIKMEPEAEHEPEATEPLEPLCESEPVSTMSEPQSVPEAGPEQMVEINELESVVPISEQETADTTHIAEEIPSADEPQPVDEVVAEADSVAESEPGEVSESEPVLNSEASSEPVELVVEQQAEIMLNLVEEASMHNTVSQNEETNIVAAESVTDTTAVIDKTIVCEEVPLPDHLVETPTLESKVEMDEKEPSMVAAADLKIDVNPTVQAESTSTTAETVPKQESSSTKSNSAKSFPRLAANGPLSKDFNGSPKSGSGKGRWYPGKYILERRARLGSNKDSFLMNSEEAQSHYKDFLGESESRKSVSSLSVSTKLLMDHATSTLSQEDNLESKDEIRQLLEDLQARQAIISSIEEEIFKSAQVTVGDKGETSLSNSHNNDDDFMKEVLEEIGPLSSSTSGTSSRSTAPTAKSLKPPSDTSPKPNMSKARSKRFGLFGTSYQDSNDHESEGLFDEADDLSPTPTPSQKNRPLINKAKDYFNSLTSSILLDDKDSTNTEKNAGLDLLLDGSQPLAKANFGGLSEADLIRSHVASRRSNPTPKNQTVDELLMDRGFLPNTKNTGSDKDKRLFASQDDRDSESQPAKHATDASAENCDEMDYQEFLFKFTKCPELVNNTRQFILSIIGPLGDGNPPAKGKKVDYIFYGNHRMDERCKLFFDDMQAKFVTFPVFQEESQESIISARDCLEQYVMQRIGDIAFQFVETAADDDQLLRRMKLLSFLTPAVLDIKPELFSEALLNLAGDELRKINTYKTPGEKIACVVKCVTIIFRSLSLCRAKQELDKDTKDKEAHSSGGEEGSGMQLAGADDFLPLFIWVVLRSHIPRLCSNCEYIQAYLNPHRLMSKSGYCLINLRSAMEFVTYIEPSSINIDPEYFEQQLAAADQQLQELEDQQ